MLNNFSNNFFGLDISDGALRIVKLKKSGKKIYLESFGEIELPSGTIVKGDIVNKDKFITTLKQLFKNIKGKKLASKNTITVLPETKTFVQVITINQAKTEEQILEQIKLEIQNQIPLTFDEIYLDWQMVNQKTDTLEILIGAAPKNTVDTYFDCLEKLDLMPHVFEIEAAAIIRSLIQSNDNQAKIIIDFGASRSGLIVCDNGIPQFTVSLAISGNQITETIAKTLDLETEKAEKAKVICGLDPKKCDGALVKILLTNINNLAKQIQKSISFYQSSAKDKKTITEIIICGGGANFNGIDTILSEKLKLPVKIANPLTNINLRKTKFPENKILSYTTAIGLALRAFDKN